MRARHGFDEVCCDHNTMQFITAAVAPQVQATQSDLAAWMAFVDSGRVSTDDTCTSILKLLQVRSMTHW